MKSLNTAQVIGFGWHFRDTTARKLIIYIVIINFLKIERFVLFTNLSFNLHIKSRIKRKCNEHNNRNLFKYECSLM